CLGQLVGCCFGLPPSKRSGAGPGSRREKPNLHRQRESAVKCSCGSVLSGNSFSSRFYAAHSLAKTRGAVCSILLPLPKAPGELGNVAVETPLRSQPENRLVKRRVAGHSETGPLRLDTSRLSRAA